MKRVLTVGVFDLYHYGHMKVLQQARTLGNYLIAAVHDDIHQSKGCTFVYSLEQRKEMVSACRWVDEVVAYQRVDELVRQIDFDVLALGPDQDHELFRNACAWCRKQNREVIVIPRTPEISSTYLRRLVFS